MFGTKVSPQGLTLVEQAAGMLNKIREMRVFVSNGTVQMLIVNKTNETVLVYRYSNPVEHGGDAYESPCFY
jgi:hypothetical protein